ncbi:twin-arginine translocase subunit TatC [Jidongwangia harbinensis]|uniref:twin-arginine translocase subunit TatC n=1 Tax=Jidongwangia harbinensis TaxID=2878561 RepID=UPI001CD949A4|nr:twin-arginine translocase subunit TatC [Jidongwangia harbinensis]MCA2219441.1 twin-arginine translocase subunit TatC [Jidongwangia harbinensis]
MALTLRRKGPSKFEQAADGSMTLIEHVRELRNRLFWASVAVVAGFIVGFILSKPAFDILQGPYCALPSSWELDRNGRWACEFVTLGPTDQLVVRLKISLYLGLIVGAPVWLYQLWAFIAPGLHRHERKWAYLFVGIAAPLFAAGAVLAYFVVEHGLAFIMESGVLGEPTQLEVKAYIDFVTTMLVLFGVGFEFPLLLLMLNVAGIATGRRLLSWWRVVIFLSFAFAAVASPDPGPFGMTLLAACMSALYFVAVGVAFLYDRHKGRGKELYEGIDDDAVSPLAETPEPVTAGDRVEVATTIESPTPVTRPLPLDNRYDDMT